MPLARISNYAMYHLQWQLECSSWHAALLVSRGWSRLQVGGIFLLSSSVISVISCVLLVVANDVLGNQHLASFSSSLSTTPFATGSLSFIISVLPCVRACCFHLVININIIAIVKALLPCNLCNLLRACCHPKHHSQPSTPVSFYFSSLSSSALSQQVYFLTLLCYFQLLVLLVCYNYHHLPYYHLNDKR